MKGLSFILATALGLGVGARSAQAQEHELYFTQAGAMLTYANAEARVLYGVVAHRIFDPQLTKTAAEELGRVITGTKKQIDKTDALLPEKLAKNSAALLKLRESLVSAERELAKFNTTIDLAIERLTVDEDEALDEEDEEGEAPPETDWSAIRTRIAWIAKDLGDAKTQYVSLTRRLSPKPLRKVPRVSGKRPE